MALSDKVEKLQHELAQPKMAHIGPKSEPSKMPRVSTNPSTPDERLAKRRAQAANRAQTETVRTGTQSPGRAAHLPELRNDKLKPIDRGRTTAVYEFVPARFIRHEHVQGVPRAASGSRSRSPSSNLGAAASHVVGHLQQMRLRQRATTSPPRREHPR
jgi:transposase